MNKQEQNIFNAKIRSQDDVIKAPFSFQGRGEEEIQAKLLETSQKNNQVFLKYMQKHYSLFNHKINKCKLNCADQGTSYADIKRCYTNCESGLKTFRRFVDQRITQMQKLMNECVSRATELPDTLNETYRCYELYNRGFSHLRTVINQESLYYQ